VSGPRTISEQSEENEWWSVLEVSQYATAEEIRRSYLRSRSQTEADRGCLASGQSSAEADLPAYLPEYAQLPADRFDGLAMLKKRAAAM
jgi:hypothetical protein